MDKYFLRSVAISLLCLGVVLAPIMCACTPMKSAYYTYETSARITEEFSGGTVPVEIRTGRDVFLADLQIKRALYLKYKDNGYIPIILYARPEVGKIYAVIRVYLKDEPIERDTYAAEVKTSQDIFTYIREHGSR